MGGSTLKWIYSVFPEHLVVNKERARQCTKDLPFLESKDILFKSNFFLLRLRNGNDWAFGLRICVEVLGGENFLVVFRDR